MTENMIHLLRQILKDSIDPKTLQSSDRFFKPGEQAKVYGIKMTDITKIAKEFYKEIDGQPKTQIFELCEQLWQSGYLEEAVIACEWAYSLRKEYAPEDFEVFERWLSVYVDNWASCDTLCNHTIGTFVEQYPQYISRLKAWTKSDNRWVRRGAAVTLIIPARKGLFFGDIIEIATSMQCDRTNVRCLTIGTRTIDRIKKRLLQHAIQKKIERHYTNGVLTPFIQYSDTLSFLKWKHCFLF